MASKCSRIMNRATISSLKSAFKKSPSSSFINNSTPTSFPKISTTTSSPLRRFCLSRCFIYFYLFINFWLNWCYDFSRYIVNSYLIFDMEKDMKLNRVPSELGAVQSMLPLHSAVATARMTSYLSSTSRSCRALSQGILCCTSPDL